LLWSLWVLLLERIPLRRRLGRPIIATIQTIITTVVKPVVLVLSSVIVPAAIEPSLNLGLSLNPHRSPAPTTITTRIPWPSIDARPSVAPTTTITTTTPPSTDTSDARALA